MKFLIGLVHAWGDHATICKRDPQMGALVRDAILDDPEHGAVVGRTLSRLGRRKEERLKREKAGYEPR